MEIFSLALSIPLAYFASLLYGKFLLKALVGWPWISRLFAVVSCCVILTIITEWILLATLGCLSTRQHLGPTFDYVHSMNFLLGPPALINILVCSNPVRGRSPAEYVILLGMGLAVVLLFQNVAVSEAL